MPCLKILTNLQRVKIPKDFVPKILPVLSKCVRKPVEKFIVTVTTDCLQSINGDDVSPSIVASLESIGNLGPAENNKIAMDITEFIEKELGVDKNQCFAYSGATIAKPCARARIFITFYDLQASDVAKGGVTIG